MNCKSHIILLLNFFHHQMFKYTVFCKIIMIILWTMLSSLGAYAATSKYLESMTYSMTPPSKRKGSSILIFPNSDPRDLAIFGGLSFEKNIMTFGSLGNILISGSV